MKTNIVLRIFMIFMTAVICMAVPMDASAQKQQAKGEGEFKAMFNEAYNQFRNKRGLEIADSLYHLAMEAGNTQIAVRSLLIPVKHECIKGHNEEAMLRVTERFMSEAKKYGYMDFFIVAYPFVSPIILMRVCTTRLWLISRKCSTLPRAVATAMAWL